MYLYASGHERDSTGRWLHWSDIVQGCATSYPGSCDVFTGTERIDLEVQAAETHCENALYGIDRSVGDINAALQRRARTPTPPPQGAILRPGPHEFRGELAVPHPLETIKLPLHELPKFNGHYADWPAFWDQFRNTVHERRIGDTTKLSYLKNCLTGEAYDLVKELRLVDGSYEIALQLLRQRFEDPKMILRELLDGLFAVSQAHPNNYASLRRVVSTFQEKITGLREIGYDAGFVSTHASAGA